MKSFKDLLVGTGMVLAVGLSLPAKAAVDTYSAPTTAVWDTASWTKSVGAPAFPNGAGEIVNFNATPPTPMTLSATAPALTAYTVGQINKVGSGSGAFHINVGTATGGLILDNSGGNVDANVAMSGTTNAAISSTGSNTMIIDAPVTIANTDLDIGQTGDGGMQLNGGLNVIASQAHALNIYANGGNTSSTVILLAGNIGSSGGTLAINNLGTATGTGSSLGVVVISGNLQTNVGTVTQNSAFSQLTLSGTNTFTGGVTLAQGTLKLGSTTALGAAAGTFAIASGTLDSTVSGLTIANGNAITINGNFAFAGSNSLNLGTGAVSLGTAAGTSRTITGTASSLTMGGIISDGTTANSIVKLGTGSVILTGASTAANSGYDGSTTVSAGTLTISGLNGSIASSSGYVLNGGTLSLDNTAGNVDRINNTGSVTLSLGGQLNLTQNATTNTTETMGTWAIDNGSSIVTIASAASRVTTLAASGFSRANHATALIRGSSLSQSQGTNVSRLTLASTAGLTLVGTNTLTSGATNDSTKALTIVPYLIGDTSTANSGSNFVTYDTTLGFRVLLSGEDVTLTAGYATPANHDNAIAFNGTLTNVTSLNSLLFNGTQALNGTGALTIDSGAVALVTNNAASIGSGFSSLALRNDEGVFTVTQNTLTINAPITVTNSGGITKSGAGTLVLNAVNGYAGVTTLNQGILTLAGNNTGGGGVTLNVGTLNINASGTSSADSALGTGTLTINNSGLVTLNNTSGSPVALGTNNAQVWNGDFTFTGSNNLDLGSGAVTLNQTIQVTVSAKVLTVGGIITDGSNGFGITKAGAGILALGSSSTYSGNTTVNTGVLRLLGTDLPSANSNVRLNGTANIEITGNSVLAFGTAANQVQLLGTTNGFGAVGGNWTLDLGGVTWGTSGFTPTTALQLGTTTSDSQINVITSGGNTFALGSTARTINTVHGSQSTTAADAQISGVISGTGSLAVQGSWLALTGLNTYTGNTTVNSGILEVNTILNAGVASSAGAATGTAINGSSNIFVNGATLKYTGSGNTTNRVIFAGNGGSSSATIDSSGTGALVFTNNGYMGGFSNGGTHTFILAGTNQNLNTFLGIYNQQNISGPATTNVLKNGTGTWVLAGTQSQYSDGTTVRAGTLIAGGDAINKIAASTPATVSTANDTLTFTGANPLLVGDKVVIGSTAGTNLSPTSTFGNSINTSLYTVFSVGSDGNPLSIQLTTNGSTAFNITGTVSGNATVSQLGVFGTSNSAIALGDASTGSSDAPTLLLGTGSSGFTTNRRITLTTSVAAGPAAATYTLGGATDAVNTFSGLITANKNLTVSQVATTGANGLAMTGGLVGSTAASTPTTVTFAGPGAINQSTAAIADGAGSASNVSVAVTGGTTTLGFANTYSGGTGVFGNGTKLAAAVDGALGSGQVQVASGAVLELDSFLTIDDNSNLILNTDGVTNGTVFLNFSHSNQETVNSLMVGGSFVPIGIYDSSSALTFGYITGTGELNVVAAPEPGSLSLIGLTALALLKRRNGRRG